MQCSSFLFFFLSGCSCHLSSWVPASSGMLGNPINSFRTQFLQLHRASLQDQYQNLRFCWCSQSPQFKDGGWFVSSLHTHKIWKSSVEKYKSCETLSKTLHFLCVFCEAGVVQQCTKAQLGVVQEGLINIWYPPGCVQKGRRGHPPTSVRLRECVSKHSGSLCVAAQWLIVSVSTMVGCVAAQWLIVC